MFEAYFRFLPATGTGDHLILAALNLNNRYLLLENYFFQREVGTCNVLPYETQELLVNFDEFSPTESIIKKFLF